MRLPRRIWSAAAAAFLELVHAIEERFDGPELLDELGRRLVAHAGNAGDVVGGVAPERLVVDQLDRLEAVALAHLVRPVENGVGDAAPGH
jgi:hypothetical protein